MFQLVEGLILGNNKEEVVHNELSLQFSSNIYFTPNQCYQSSIRFSVALTYIVVVDHIWCSDSGPMDHMVSDEVLEHAHEAL
jgi:hypothetical protein